MQQPSEKSYPRGFYSLRARALLLLGAAFAALLGIAGLLAAERRQDSISNAIERVQATALLAAEEQNNVVAFAEQFLGYLGQARDLSAFSMDPKCPAVLAETLRREPRFSNIAIVAANGDFLCAAVPAAGTTNIKDRDYFKTAMAAPAPIIGEPVVSRSTGKAVLPFASTLRDDAGRVRVVYLVMLDLAWLSNHLTRGNYPPGARLGVISGSGQVLTRYPDPENWVGKDASQTAFFKALTAHGGAGSGEAPGLDGVKRIYGFARFAATAAGPVYLWVGVDKETVVGKADRVFAWSMAGATALLLVTIVVLWLGSERLFMRPVSALSDAARRLGEGDAGARTGLPQSDDELGQLARSFDEMAESLASTSGLLEANRALHASEREFRLLAESMPQIVWVTRRDGWNTYFNHQWVEYTGLSLEESYGHGWNKPFHPDDQQRTWDAWQTAVNNKGGYSVECRLRKADGSYRWWLIRGTPVLDDQGQIYKWFGTCTDIQDLKQAEHRLRELNETLEQRVLQRTSELDAANKELEAFAYSVSHDLRAPLRAIDGFAKILEEDYADRVDEEGKDSLRRVRAAAQKMGQLIDDLLRLSRLARVEMNAARVDLSALARSVADAFAAGEPARDVRFEIAQKVVARGDRRLLEVVLENLIGNAWKFTGKHPHARIEFGVSEDGGEPAYFVRDDGAGFDMAHAGKLFAPFQRLHGAGEFPGTGIGLATVRRVVARHGGRTWAEGAVEKGATFYFTLPAAGLEAPSRQREAALA